MCDPGKKPESRRPCSMDEEMCVPKPKWHSSQWSAVSGQKHVVNTTHYKITNLYFVLNYFSCCPDYYFSIYLALSALNTALTCVIASPSQKVVVLSEPVYTTKERQFDKLLYALEGLAVMLCVYCIAVLLSMRARTAASQGILCPGRGRIPPPPRQLRM